MNLALVAAIGVAVLVISTIGFGASLSTAPVFNRIGASDNQAVNAARGNVTALTWTEKVDSTGAIKTDQITFSVGNEDTANAHTFQVCATIKLQNGTSTPNSGQAPDCTTTGSISASAIAASQSITISAPVLVSEINDISFTIEETS